MSVLDSLIKPQSDRLLHGIFLAIALLVLLCIGLGHPPLFDVDEGAFSEATRELLASGDWGHTTLNGTDRFDKPIGVYWLQAISVSIFGPNEFAVRLPSALATWIAALALWRFVAPRWGQDAGRLAAVIHTTAFGSWAMAHAATADGVLGLCLMLCAVDLWRYLESEQPRALLRLALWVGLGILVKGPVALLIPAASLFMFCLSMRQWRPLWRALSDFRAWLCLLLVALPWYLYALDRHGLAFIDGFILRHNIDRFAAPMEGHSGAWFYFLLVAPLLWMPWSPLLLTWLGRWRDIWKDLRLRAAAIWCIFVLVFFSISGTKLPHYGLYAAPGLVILLVAGLSKAPPWVGWLCGAAVIVWHVLFVTIPVILTNSPEHLPAALAQHLAGRSQGLDLTPIVAAWCLMAMALCCLKVCRSVFTQTHVLTWMAMVHTVVLTMSIWPWWAHTLQGPIKKLAITAREMPGEIAQFGGNWPSFAFYREQAMVKDLSQADMLLMPKIASSAYPQWRLVVQERGMVLLRRPDQAQ